MEKLRNGSDGQKWPRKLRTMSKRKKKEMLETRHEAWVDIVVNTTRTAGRRTTGTPRQYAVVHEAEYKRKLQYIFALFGQHARNDILFFLKWVIVEITVKSWSNSVLEWLHRVDVGDVAGVSSVYSVSTFEVEGCKVGEFPCLNCVNKASCASGYGVHENPFYTLRHW